MCKFKSGIILKSRSYVAESYDESHTNLLEKLNIEDTRENAMRKFVRVELIPDNNEWWTDPSTWKINIDQDILPDWFEKDKEKYVKEFIDRVTDWWNDHVFVDKTIEELEGGYYRLKRCEVKRLLNDVKVILCNSIVQEMFDNSIVQAMEDNSTVQKMFDSSIVQVMENNSIVQEMFDSSTVWVMGNNATVQKMYNSSMVQEMEDNSTVQKMWRDSIVKKMYGNAIVQKMWDNATVQEMYNNSIVQKMYNHSTVQEMFGSSTVQEMWGNSIIARDLEDNVIVSETSRVILKHHQNQKNNDFI